MKRSPLAVLFLAVLIDLLGFGIVLPLLPQYGDEYGASNAMLAALMASFSAMQFIFAPMWGRLSDRFGRRPIILVGFAGSVLSYTLFGLAVMDGFAGSLGCDTPVPILLASRIAAGIFAATIATAYAYIADVTTAETRGKGMALVGAAFGVGFTLGPVVGGLSHAYIGTVAPGFVAAGLSLVALLFAWRVLPEPEGRKQSPAKGFAAFRQLGKALSDRTVMIVLALQFFATFAFANLEGVLAVFARRKLNYSVEDNTWLFCYLGFTLLIAQGVVVRRLLPKVGELNFAVFGTLILGGGLAGVGIATEPWHAWTALPIGVLGFAMLTTALASLLSRRTPDSIQGEVMGVGQSTLSLARILGPAVGNLLLLETMLALPFWTGAAVMGISFVLALWLRALPAPPTEPPTEPTTPPSAAGAA